METQAPKSNFVPANGIRLHYLDWGGSGHPLLFIPGMGCSAYIFGKFAPRFVDRYHVLAMDRRGHGDSDYPQTGYDADTLAEDLRCFLDNLHMDRAILVGHSLGYIELSRFAVLYPQRVIKLVYLDAAYDRTAPDWKAMMAKNPMPKMIPPWPEEGFERTEDYFATVRRLYPSLALIWDKTMEEQARHNLKTTPEGKVVDKMSPAIEAALNNTVNSYVADYSAVQVPALSVFVFPNPRDYLSMDYMTQQQRDEVVKYYETVRLPFHRQYTEEFQRCVPHAKVVTIPNGHHYCFMKQEEIVYEEMSKFLAE